MSQEKVVLTIKYPAFNISKKLAFLPTDKIEYIVETAAKKIQLPLQDNYALRLSSTGTICPRSSTLSQQALTSLSPLEFIVEKSYRSSVSICPSLASSSASSLIGLSSNVCSNFFEDDDDEFSSSFSSSSSLINSLSAPSLHTIPLSPCLVYILSLLSSSYPTLSKLSLPECELNGTFFSIIHFFLNVLF